MLYEQINDLYSMDEMVHPLGKAWLWWESRIGNGDEWTSCTQPPQQWGLHREFRRKSCAPTVIRDKSGYVRVMDDGTCDTWEDMISPLTTVVTKQEGPFRFQIVDEPQSQSQQHQASDGSTASYYELPAGATELQDLISAKDMNSQIGEIFRACYRYGQVPHSPKLRDAKKIRFYIDAEIKRLEGLQG